jgi:predicted CopG family antitoxin
MVSKPFKTVRIDQESYDALVKHKTGMMSLGEMIRHSLEAFGYLEKKEDDPFWFQARLTDKLPNKRRSK